jgi:hypothetical protein
VSNLNLPNSDDPLQRLGELFAARGWLISNPFHSLRPTDELICRRAGVPGMHIRLRRHRRCTRICVALHSRGKVARIGPANPVLHLLELTPLDLWPRALTEDNES